MDDAHHSDQAHEMIQGLENMLAEQTVLVERTAEVMRQRHAHTHLWTGCSGEPLTGGQIADHLTATARLLQRNGWTPNRNTEPIRIIDTTPADAAEGVYAHTVAPRRHSLNSALWDVARGPGDLDTYTSACTILGLVLCARTGAETADPMAWERKRDRTAVEVEDLLDTAICFAHRYGPSGSGR
ncbi:DUF6197 family protein [Streptomyces synnematoformans]|uniref:Uncharacterized protein n=1 Tax=Streptomyces synnematoformans TaxID=415721 RepID=A0ABN2XFR1_9ACTN